MIDAINFPAVVVAVLWTIVLGFLWYGPLFGKAWAESTGVDISKKPSSREMTKSMLIMLVASWFMVFCLAHSIEAYRVAVPSVEKQAGDLRLDLAINGGFFTWLGSFFVAFINMVAFERRSFKFFFVQSGYYLVALWGASFLLAYWVK